MPKKWFADPQLMSTTFSVSHVCNNLSKHEDILAYAHINDVIYVNSADTPYQAHKLPITDKFYVHQTRVCNLHSSTFIVVATESGIQIFDEKGDQSLYSFSLKDENVTAEEGRALFCRGICVVHSETPSIAVGSSVGNVFVLGTSQSAKVSSASDHEFELLQTLGDSRDAIQCLDGSQHGALLAASDDSGSVVVRNGDDSFSIVHTIPAAGGDAFPVTSLRFTDDGLLVCAYVTGLLRIYNKGNFRLHAEIAAHTRAITALDVCEQFIVSVGEDTFMNVWETSGSASAPRVKLVSSQCVANDLLNGVVFVERNSARKSILTSSFDTTHLKLWQQE